MGGSNSEEGENREVVEYQIDGRDTVPKNKSMGPSSNMLTASIILFLRDLRSEC